MFPYIYLFGKEIETYDICFVAALMTIPVLFIALRKQFEFTKKQTVFYIVFTLAFGLLSAWLTALLKDAFLEWASSRLYIPDQTLRNYGIPIFMPLFFLMYCLLCRDRFKRIMDYLAPGVYSVMTFVKLGCTFAGCCRGEADEHGIMNVDLGYRTFPVQVYDMLTSLAIVIVCLVLIFTLRKKHEGYIYPIGGMLFAITKGYWESYRVHTNVWERDFFNTGWTLWQYWMLVLFVGCLIWLILAIVWEKRGIPDFDRMEGLKFPRINLPFMNKEKKRKSAKT